MKVTPLFPRPYCCLCFRMDCDWSVDENGQKWDVCVECQAHENAIMAEIERVGREQMFENWRTGIFSPPPDGFDIRPKENGF